MGEGPERGTVKIGKFSRPIKDSLVKEHAV